jgi:hypothetical protein
MLTVTVFPVIGAGVAPAGAAPGVAGCAFAVLAELSAGAAAGGVLELDGVLPDCD